MLSQNVGSSCRVLLAEDCPDTRSLLKLLLEGAGAHVVEAHNGSECCDLALSAWQQEKDPFNLILMDIRMPILDGESATKKLRDAGYTMPIVAISTQATMETQNKVLSAGCDAYISKLAGSKVLLDTIKQYTDRVPTRLARKIELPKLPVVPKFLEENPQFAMRASERLDGIPETLKCLKAIQATHEWFALEDHFDSLGEFSLYGYNCLGRIVNQLQNAYEQKDIPALKKSLASMIHHLESMFSGKARLQQLATECRNSIQ